MMRRSLAEKLRVLRAQRGLSLTEAAEKARVQRQTLAFLERGERHPHMPTLSKIARGYGVPVEELLEEPATAEKASAPESGRTEAQGEEPYLSAALEWLAEVVSPNFQAASENLEEYCRAWTELQQKGLLDLEAIERFFEDAYHWDFILDAAVWAEFVDLIRTGQVHMDPHANPADVADEFLDRLYAAGKLGPAWLLWMDLSDELLETAKALKRDAKLADREAKTLERIEKQYEEQRARLTVLQGGRLSA